MVAVNAITIDQLNYYYYVLSYSFNILSPLSLSLSLSRCAFSREVFAVAVASAIQLMHYCLFFSPLSHRRECCVLARPSLSPRVISRKSLGSLSLSLSISRRPISRKLRRLPHIIGGVLRSLSRPPLSLYRCAISSKMRQPPLRVLRSLSLGPLVLSLSPFSRRRLGQLMHNC